jgi:hypothetical protein
LHKDDFVNVNCAEDTWTWPEGEIHCTGKPVGVVRSVKPYKNFELVVQWKHLKEGGNSGVFLWAPKEPLDALKPGQLPRGIEVQVLDHGYAEQYKKQTGKDSDWFTTNGDVFPVGTKMTPFPPVAPNGERSFPRKNLSLGVGQWVNGEEVSGGTGCDPAEGYLCLESEGAPIQFKNLRIRELP